MVRMKDIAERANVSRTAVSFVLNKSPLAKKLSEETRKRVLAAAEELGYRPNEIAKAMITGKTKVLGFVSNQPQREFVASMLCGAMDAAADASYNIKVIPLREEGGIQAVVNTILEQCIAGVLVQGIRGEDMDELRDQLATRKVPVARLGSSFSPDRGLRVTSNDVRGAKEAVDYLIALGHKRIAYLSGSPDFGSFVMRGEGYKKAMAGAHLPIEAEDYIELTEYDERGRFLKSVQQAREEINTVIERISQTHTAIFCSNEIIALLAVQCLRNQGLRVPADVSVVGYSDSDVAQLCDPPLTTVDQPHAEMGEQATAALIASIDGTGPNLTDAAQEIMLPTRLIVRKSTGYPRD